MLLLLALLAFLGNIYVIIKFILRISWQTSLQSHKVITTINKTISELSLKGQGQ